MFETWSDDLMCGLMTALDVVVVDYGDSADGVLVGEPPPWFLRFLPESKAGLEGLSISLGEHFLYLDSFLPDAEDFWDSAEDGRMKSGIWTESDLDGKTVHLGATVLSVSGRKLLLIERLRGRFEREREVIQKARAGKLDSQRKANEREREAAGLRGINEELEEAVADRTRELSLTNRLLREEISDREQAVARANELRQQLEAESRAGALGEIANQLAHELNQPLGAIANYLRGGLRFLARDGVHEGRAVEAIERSLVQAERAAAIIQNLRGFIASGRVDYEPTSVNGLVRDVIRLLQPEIDRNDVDCRLNLTSSLPKVTANGIQAQQVVLNLVKNAIEAMSGLDPADRLLVVSTSRAGDTEIEISVRDFGSGPEGLDLDQLFEPFYSTKVEGMGLGLAICRSIAESHQGSLIADPSPGPGLTFRFKLPIRVETHS